MFFHLPTSVTESLGDKQDDAARLVTPAESPLSPAPRNPSVGPAVVGELEGLGLMLAAILLVRFSHDRATPRSAMLVWRLEHPG
jgi:hypothetical protein